MATQVQQDYDATTDTGRIRLFPEGLAGTHGAVLDKKGNVIAPWSYPGTGEVWVAVGKSKNGTITEEDFDDKPWQIICIR